MYQKSIRLVFIMINFDFTTQFTTRTTTKTERRMKRKKKWNELHARKWSQHNNTNQRPFLISLKSFHCFFSLSSHMKWTYLTDYQIFSLSSLILLPFVYFLAFWLSLSVIVNIYTHILCHEKNEIYSHTHTLYTLLDACEWNTMALVNVCLLQNIKLCDKCNSLGLRSQFHRWVHHIASICICVLRRLDCKHKKQEEVRERNNSKKREEKKQINIIK